MKKTMKEILLITAALFMLSFAAAQQSPTYTATAETIQSNEDLVIDVTSWSEADVGDGLVSALYNGNSFPVIGGARYFGDVFVSGYVSADRAGSGKEKRYSTYTGKMTQKDEQGKNGFSFGLLLGLPEITGNWGFRLDAGIVNMDKTSNENLSYTPSQVTSTKTGNSYIELYAGTSLPLDNGTLKPSFMFGYETVFAEKKDSSNTANTVTSTNYNNTYTLLQLKAGAEYSTAWQNSVQHSFGATIEYEKAEPEDAARHYAPSYSPLTEYQKGFTRIHLNPAYTFMYKGQSFVFNAKTLGYINYNSSEYAGIESSYWHFFVEEKLGLSYKAGDRLTVNGGMELGFPTLHFAKTAPETSTTQTGSVSSSLYAGFSLDVTKNHKIDTSFDFSGSYPKLNLSVVFKK